MFRVLSFENVAAIKRFFFGKLHHCNSFHSFLISGLLSIGILCGRRNHIDRRTTLKILYFSLFLFMYVCDLVNIKL